MRLFCLITFFTAIGYGQNGGEEFKYYVTSLSGFVKNSKTNSILEFNNENLNYQTTLEEHCLNILLSNEDRVQLIELFVKYDLFDTTYGFHPKYENQPDSMVVAGSAYEVIDGKIAELYDQEISISNDTYLFFQIDFHTPGHNNVNFSVIKEKSRAADFLQDFKLLSGERVCTERIKVK